MGIVRNAGLLNNPKKKSINKHKSVDPEHCFNCIRIPNIYHSSDGWEIYCEVEGCKDVPRVTGKTINSTINKWNKSLKSEYKKRYGYHKMKPDFSEWLIDSVKCSCGWKSVPYYDGIEWAVRDWKKHARGE